MRLYAAFSFYPKKRSDKYNEILLYVVYNEQKGKWVYITHYLIDDVVHYEAKFSQCGEAIAFLEQQFGELEIMHCNLKIYKDIPDDVLDDVDVTFLHQKIKNYCEKVGENIK